MIRILQVLGSLQRGGAETMIINIYRNIDRKKIQFDFLVKEQIDNGYESEIKSLGGKIFYVESAKKIGICSYIKQIINVMKQNGPYDIVHSHVNTLSGLIMLAAKLAHIKIRISHSHTTRQDSKILKLLILLFSTDRISCGKSAGDALFGKSKYIIIPNGIDMEKFLPSETEKKELRNKLGIDNKVINICHIGRFVEVKNHKFIIEIAEKLMKSNFKFQIYLLGNGPLFENINNLINKKNLNNRIKLVGSISNANEYLKACDLFILPSLYEGLPVTLIESQCTGIQSLISDHISKEADLDLHLIKFLPLDSNLWVEFIKNKKYFYQFDNATIKKKFINKKYDINISSKMLINYYVKKLNIRKENKYD